MNKKTVSIILALILLSQTTNCFSFPKVKPGVKVAPIDTPQLWAEQNVFVTKNDPIIKWWEQFNDPLLTKYITEAAVLNYDVQIATNRILIERATRAGVKSTLYPQVDASAKYSRYDLFASKIDVEKFNTSNEAINTFNTGFDASWEMDFFGKKRWDVVSASEKIAMATENKRNVLVSLTAEIARNYMELRGNQSELIVLNKNIDVQTRNLKMMKAKQKIGLASDAEVVNVQTLLDSLKAQKPLIEGDIKSNIYNISVLTGRNPEILLEELTPQKPLPAPPNFVATGIPADLILQRADIRKAQRNLAASIASVGAAKADLYPSIKINGAFGFENINLGNLGNIRGGLWSVSPAVNWKVFDRRILKANLDVKKAQAKEADLALRQTVLNAVKDVETSINYFEKSKQTEKEVQNAMLSSKKAYEFANTSYQIGLKSQYETLELEKAYINNQSQFVKSQTQTNLRIISLYKSLGGGWQAF